MKHMRKVVVPAKEVELVFKTTCDLCRDEINPEIFVVEDVEVKCRTGHSYPESGSGEEVSFDICKNCFFTKLQPWLESQGAVPTTTEWEW